MSWTLRGSAGTWGGGDGTTIAASVADVAAGDVVLIDTGDQDSTGISGVSDGTSSLTGLTLKSFNAWRWQSFYLLASVATGTVTYTTTFAATCALRSILVYVFTPAGGTVAVDTDARAGDISTTPASGNITTTGTDELVIGSVFGQGATYSARQINGVAADGSHDDGAAIGTQFYRVVTSTFTGQANMTMGSTNTWTCNIHSYKITASGIAIPILTRQYRARWA